MPRHVNPTSRDRTALAPYNFVPLPNAVLEVPEPPNQDRYHTQLHTGSLDLQLETLTPLFIRSATAPGDGRLSRQRHEPFTVPDPDHPGRRVPAIPGSSLRGAIRTLVEILSFSKIAPVSERKPFFRSVGRDRMADAYRARMLRGNEKPRGGFLRRDGERWSIEPAHVLRMPHELLQANTTFRYRQHPSYSPSSEFPALQYATVWVQRDEKPWQCRDVSMQEPVEAAEWLCGRLVLTGSAPSKKAEFVFVPQATSRAIPIPDAIWRRFLDDDQITNWQEKSWPATDTRRAGHPREGQPVFYLLDERCIGADKPRGLVFFGRAQMFRLPYDRSPAELIAPELRGAGRDLAESLFGDVHVALGGRVRFEDARAVRGAPDWYEPVMVPQILASPKPTAFSQYLTQDGDAPTDKLTTYIDGDRTTIRGHKLYWHRWDDAAGLARLRHPDEQAKLRDLQSPKPGDTQTTCLQPVKAQVVFTGRVSFDNLTDVELGALLAALDLPQGCAHKLGLGKPLGLGSVRVSVERVTFVERRARYAGWGDDGRRHDPARVERCRSAFVTTMRAHAERNAETLVPDGSGLRGIARLDALYHLLDFEGRPPCEDTRYLKIEGGDAKRFKSPNEYKERAVLPTPHAVQRDTAREPDWPPDPPVAAQPEPESPKPATTPVHALPAPPTPARTPTPHTVRSGETVLCEVLPVRTKKGAPRFLLLADGKQGVLHPTSPPPPDLVAGARVRLVVVATGREYMLRWMDQPPAPEGDSSP